MTFSATYPIRTGLVKKSSCIHCNSCRHLEKFQCDRNILIMLLISLYVSIAFWIHFVSVGFGFFFCFCFSFLHNLLSYYIQPLHEIQRAKPVPFCTATGSPCSIKTAIILVMSCVGGKIQTYPLKGVLPKSTQDRTGTKVNR